MDRSVLGALISAQIFQDSPQPSPPFGVMLYGGAQATSEVRGMMGMTTS